MIIEHQNRINCTILPLNARLAPWNIIKTKAKKMKQILKYLGLLLLAAILFILIAGLFIAKDYHFERSITINAPREKVWEQVNNFTSRNKWNPWAEYDPGMQHTIEGTDGTVGAVHKWKGNKEVGSGSETITMIEAPDKINSILRFYEPFESEANAFITLTGEGNTTRATWGFDSRFPYPMNTMQLFMNMDKMMDKDFSNGLNKLKQNCEAL